MVSIVAYLKSRAHSVMSVQQCTQLLRMSKQKPYAKWSQTMWFTELWFSANYCIQERGAIKRDKLPLFNYKPPHILVAKPNQQKGGVISSEYGTSNKRWGTWFTVPQRVFAVQTRQCLPDHSRCRQIPGCCYHCLHRVLLPQCLGTRKEKMVGSSKKWNSAYQ